MKYANSKINYAGAEILESDADFVRDAVLDGFYENYKKYTSLLESELSNLLNVKHVLVVNSATAALHLALESIGVSSGDEVITTDSSCVASAMPILYTGAKAKFADVDNSDLNISPESVKALITAKTKAILPVHWNGHPADIKQISAIAKDNDLYVIEDAAAALGSKVDNQYVGTFGDVGCFSFQGAKVAIGGQGGAVVTNNTELYERMKCLSSYGRTDSKKQYWSDFVGWNYGMPSVVAALVISQIRRLDHLVNLKRNIFNLYEEGLRGNKNVRLIKERDSSCFSNCCYPPLELLKTCKINRTKLLNNLNELNIDARPIQPQISQMPMFEENRNNINAKSLEDSGIILPSALNLNKKNIAMVCDAINSFTN